ncbi:(2Fe-2S)-binding protein [Aquirufa ecclesiirivi]
MSKYSIKLNGKKHLVDVASDTPLLWVIRDEIGMTGTKFGCGMGLCGACTVLLNGKPIRSCSTPISSIKPEDKLISIEGLSTTSSHPVQLAWIKEQVPQCGYCQSGQILAVASLLDSNPNPTDQDIDTALAGNICRCGTYQDMRKAIHAVAKSMQSQSKTKSK